MYCTLSRIACISLALLCIGRAQADKLDDLVKEQMQKQHIPGVSVAIVKDGKVVEARGYGLASVELNVPATKDTVYEIGSITKQFTATLVMMLVEENKIALTDPIKKYLPDAPAAWDKVTVRHLLTHTSGIKGYTEVGDFITLARTKHTKEEIIGMVSKLPLDFQPGEKWSYSNTGYYLLGMIVEKASGKSYDDLLAERILKPLQMTVTRNGDPDTIIPNRAAGYMPVKDGWRNASALQPTAAFSAGELVSTVLDMAKWDAALYTDKLVKTATLEQMWTAATLNNGKPTGYGFGWAVGEVNKHRLIEHGGGTAGFSTVISRFPTDRLTVLVLTNRAEANPNGISHAIAGLYEPALVPPPDKPIEDKEPKLTALFKSILTDAADGKVNPDLFTPDAQKEILPRIKESKATFAQFGALKSLTLVEQKEIGDTKAYRYRAEFANVKLRATFVLDKAGKIAGAGLQPE